MQAGRSSCACRLSPDACSHQDRTLLLYKASRDGWTKDDFFRCCSDKRGTLTLVRVSPSQSTLQRVGCNLAVSLTHMSPPLRCAQVSGNDFLFGAFTAAAWPNQPAGDAPDVVVPDPTGMSFMFSLKHKYGDRPFSLPLRHKARAIFTDASSFGFGGEEYDADGKCVLHQNVCLNNGGAANHADANFATDPSGDDTAYHTVVWHDGATEPEGFELDEQTITGDNQFGCAEIEVYSLR